MIDDFNPPDSKPFDEEGYTKRLGELNHDDTAMEAFNQARNAHDLNEMCLRRGEHITHLEKHLARTSASLESQKRLCGMLISALSEISTDDPT